MSATGRHHRPHQLGATVGVMATLTPAGATRRVPAIAWICGTIAFTATLAAGVLLSLRGASSTPTRDLLALVLQFAATIASTVSAVYAGATHTAVNTQRLPGDGA